MRLTTREAQIMALLQRGMTSKQMAQELGISPNTARGYVCDLLRRYEQKTRAALLALYVSKLGGLASGRGSDRRRVGSDRRSGAPVHSQF